MGTFCYADYSRTVTYNEGGISYQLPEIICVEVPDVEPETPTEVPGETDPGGSVVLPGGDTAALTAFALTFKGVKQIAWQARPWKVLWCVRTDGLLIGLTYDKDEDVWAWHRHPMVNGAVMSAQVIPGADNHDEVWLVVRRMIGGVQKHYVEKMTSRIEPADINDKARYNYLDCSLSYSGVPNDTFSGLDHLEGQTVRAWADGVEYGPFEVDGGAITLPVEASEVKIGVHTDSIMLSLPAARLRTERQIVEGIDLHLHNSMEGEVGRGEHTEALQYRRPEMNMDQAPPLYTGLASVNMGGGWDDDGYYAIKRRKAGPLGVLAAYPRYKTGTS